MRHRRLGHSGLLVSELCLGTLHLQDDADYLFHAFVESGGNFVDTANVYRAGASEQLLGRLMEGRRNELVVCTKYTCATRGGDPNSSGNGRKNLHQSLEASLRRLKTDVVDVLWLHAWDERTPLEEINRSLEEVVEAGKVRYIGLSDTPAWLAARLQGLAGPGIPFVALQVEYGLTHRSPELELLPMARALGLGVTVWGALSGVLGPAAPMASGGLVQDRASGRALALSVEVANIASELGTSAARVALAWLRQQPGEVFPILSPVRIEHLLDGLGCLALKLSEEHLQRLAAAGSHAN